MTDPCEYCQHHYEEYNRDAGWDYGCDCPEEFAIDFQKPCPYFKPRLPSDELFEQLANEDEARLQYEKWVNFNRETI